MEYQIHLVNEAAVVGVWQIILKVMGIRGGWMPVLSNQSVVIKTAALHKSQMLGQISAGNDVKVDVAS